VIATGHTSADVLVVRLYERDVTRMAPFASGAIYEGQTTLSLVYVVAPAKEERIMRRRIRQREALSQRLARDLPLVRLAVNNMHSSLKRSRLRKATKRCSSACMVSPCRRRCARASHLEVDVWMDLKNKLEQRAEHRTLQSRLRSLQKLLALKREMLHSPLVRRYQQATERLLREQQRIGP